MNRVICPNGHFYDGDKYSACPHCAEGVKAVEPSYFDHISKNQKATEPQDEKKEKKKGIRWKKDNSEIPSSETFYLFGRDETMEQKSEYTATPGTASIGSNIVSKQTENPANSVSYSNTGAGVAEQEVSRQSMDLGSAIKAAQTPSVPKVQLAYNQAPSDEGKTVGFFSNGLSDDPPVGYLICIAGDDFGRGFLLKSGNNAIGRSQSMDVVITDPKVSREKQAFVLYEPHKRVFYVKPGEGNGLCYFNDELVMMPMQINPYDVITIGDTRLMLIAVCSERFSWEDVEK